MGEGATTQLTTCGVYQSVAIVIVRTTCRPEFCLSRLMEASLMCSFADVALVLRQMCVWFL